MIELGKKEGREFEYVVFKDQGHGSADVQQNIKWVENILEFFRDNL
ncbi:MAG: prolyl oligopeptidase family serine peptidase [Candidatus Hodarchaeales archaeon]